MLEAGALQKAIFNSADISDPRELIGRAKELSEELEMPIHPGIEDIYELTYIC